MPDHLKSRHSDHMQMYWIIYDILVSVKDMHARKFVHRDIAAGNVLLIWDQAYGNGAGRYVAVLCDFGFSKTTDNTQLRTKIQKENYSAPEMFGADAKFNHKIDCYSIGIIVFWIFNGKMPFTNPEQFRARVITAPEDAQGLKLHEMTLGLTEIDPEKRWDCQRALNVVIPLLMFKVYSKYQLPLLKEYKGEGNALIDVTKDEHVLADRYFAGNKETAMAVLDMPGLDQNYIQDGFVKCAYWGNIDMLKLYVNREKGASAHCDAPNSKGQTALVSAIQGGEWSCAKELLGMGASPTAISTENGDLWNRQTTPVQALKDKID